MYALAFRRARRLFAAAVVAALACARPAAAQDDALVTDRPDFTESTNVVRPRRVQAEAGYTFESAGGERSHSVGETLLRVGVHRGVELRLGFSSYAVALHDGAESTRGLEDASVGVKLALPRSVQATGWMPEAALIVATSLPTGADAFSSGAAEPEAKLALGWSLGERAGLSSNLNYAWLAGDDGRVGERSGSVSLGVSLAERVGAYAEYYAFRADAGVEDVREFVNGGLTYRLSPDLQLDARVGARATGPSDRFVGVGIARRW